MDRTLPTLLDQAETSILALCEDHLTHEETLLADMLHSLRQVRDAFCQRNLSILPILQSHQQKLARDAAEMTAARDRLRAVLAHRLGVAPEEATLRAAALSLEPPARQRLLERHAQLTKLIRQAEQLGQQNAAMLGYARGFLADLFAGLTGACVSERYGPDGERRAALYGSFLEARV